MAQIRFLDEDPAAAPYGQGVFVGKRYWPQWATSKLVFAGYCKPEMKLHWTDANHLAVECVTTERAPKLFPAPDGIHVSLRGGI